MTEEGGHGYHDRLRLDASEITSRARAAYGPDGRLALPKVAHWPIFPFETDDLRMRHVEDPVVPEAARHGEAAEDCDTCRSPDDAFLWTDAGWRVSMSKEPISLPAVWLESRDHIDFDDLTDEGGAEMGVLLVRIHRALASIEGVGRVHVNRWGDGGAHLHVWVVARPLGMVQLRGMFLLAWMYALPPLPDGLWTAIRSHVAASLDMG